MREDSQTLAESAAPALSAGFLALAFLTLALIVLGALVRAHGAGLACPDWPLCFGELVPRMDLKVAFEWSHRVVAGSVALVFAGLSAAAWRSGAATPLARRLLVVAAALLAVQIVLGGLTVLLLLASWTVTAHLLTGNAFAAALLLVACELRDRDLPPRPPIRAGERRLVLAAAALLGLQLALGGLVSSGYAGMACPEWPTCNGGRWFPSLRGAVGLHLLHRTTGYALVLLLAGTAWACRGDPGLRRLSALALALGACQVAVGAANVLLGVPVELTALHSALAAALVWTLALSAREVALRPAAPG